MSGGQMVTIDWMNVYSNNEYVENLPAELGP